MISRVEARLLPFGVKDGVPNHHGSSLPSCPNTGRLYPICNR
jgi:hypothetical protein